jgi:cell division protein ZapA
MSTRVVHVDIHGQRYAVRSDLDPHYVGELATYLDERMRAAAQELASADPLRIAVIAALNICDEVFRSRADSHGAEHQLRLRAMEIERLVDSVLDEAKAQIVVNQ